MRGRRTLPLSGAILLILLVAQSAFAAGVDLDLQPRAAIDNAGADTGLTRSQKAWLLNLGAAGTILTWGVLNWDYFSQPPKTKNEQWFGHGTKEGGADKFGHLWTAYAMTHGFAAAYRHFGYDEETAARYGTFSAFGVTGIMEVGDSFSEEHGFSYEDMIANTVGAGIGYLLLHNPEWQERLDLRWEYNPDFSDFETDVTTDYQHSKYLLAVKAEGFELLRETPLKYLELHFGYYARGYDSSRSNSFDPRERYLYAGLGINVGRLIRPLWDTKLFNYMQVPNTDLQVKHGLE